jgi:uncharacterized protein (DUF2147 family)
MSASLVALLSLVASQAAATPVVGDWTNPAKSVVVQVAPCGSKLCGTVKWASETAKNDARRAGTQALVGTELLQNYKFVRPGHWRGVLFVPDRKVRTRAELIAVETNILRIRACTAGGLLCKSQVWTRVEAQ